MKLLSKKVVLSVLAAIVGVGFVGGALVAHANPLQFVPTVQTATATTTRAYLTTATTATTTFDSFTPGGQIKAANNATFFLQVEASSTSSIIGVKFQYSQDGVDWYEDNISLAATTTVTNIQTPHSYTWPAQTVATSSRAFTVPTPTRYVRAVVSTTGASASIWNQFIPLREAN